MTKKIIRTKLAPQPVGPYNQAIMTGHFIFTSGQIAIDTVSGDPLSGDIVEQTRTVLNYIKSILQHSGSSLEKVVKTTVYLKDMKDFAAMNKVYQEFFDPTIAPARSTIEVARLPKDMKVEIEVVATV